MNAFTSNTILLFCFIFLHFSAYAQPANNNLCGAIPLNINDDCSTTFPYDNFGADAEPAEPVGSCFPDAINSSVWFSFVAPPSGIVNINTDFTNSGLQDTQMALYFLSGGDCTDLSGLFEIDCNEDAIPSPQFTNFNAQIPQAQVSPGQIYYIQLDTYFDYGNNDPIEGNFCVVVSEIIPPPNDNCENAQAYGGFGPTCTKIWGDGQGPTPEYASTIGATAGNAIDVFTCDGTDLNATVYYSFLAGVSEVEFNLLTGDNINVAVFTNPDASNCDNGSIEVSGNCFTNIDSSDQPDPMEPDVLFTNLQPGSSYIMAIWSNPGEETDFSFCLTRAPTYSCGDGVCYALAENYGFCPQDCACLSSIDFFSFTTGQNIDLPQAVCPEITGDITNPNNPGLYIPFTINTDDTDLGDSSVATSAGTLFTSTTPPTPLPGNQATNFIILLYLTEAEINAGGSITISFTSDSGACTTDLIFNIADIIGATIADCGSCNLEVVIDYDNATCSTINLISIATSLNNAIGPNVWISQDNNTVFDAGVDISLNPFGAQEILFPTQNITLTIYDEGQPNCAFITEYNAGNFTCDLSGDCATNGEPASLCNLDPQPLTNDAICNDNGTINIPIDMGSSTGIVNFNPVEVINGDSSEGPFSINIDPNNCQPFTFTATDQSVCDFTPIVTVNTPSSVAGGILVSTNSSDWGLQIFYELGPCGTSSSVTGELATINDGDTSGGQLTDFCEPTPPVPPNQTVCDQISDKIALIDRGQCTFVSKAQNAQACGAIGVIICNCQPGPGWCQADSDALISMAGSDYYDPVGIPAVFMSYQDCQELKMAMNDGPVEACIGTPSTIPGCDREFVIDVCDDIANITCDNVQGCTNPNACNYNVDATIDNGTCYNVGDNCNDNNVGTENDVYIDCSTCEGTAVAAVCPEFAKINEFHYDNAGTDVNEFVEIILPFGTDPSYIQIHLYDGASGTFYATTLLSFASYNTDYYFDYYVWNTTLQNGNDGIAVSCIDGTLYQFITYEGAFTPTDGPFAGITGNDVGVAEINAETFSSIMCDGNGVYFTNCFADPGVGNNLITCQMTQPDNDECNIASPYPGIIENGVCVNNWDFTQYTSSGASPLISCDGGDATAWFSFTVPVTTSPGETLNLQWDAGNNCFIGIQVFDTACSQTVSNCLNNNDGILTNLLQGNDYIMAVWDDGSGSPNCDFCLTIAPPPPPGDECSDPIPYPGDIESGTCAIGFDFTSFNSNIGLSPFISCAGFGGSQAWFTITTPITTAAGEPINLLFDAGYCDLGIEFYTIDCSYSASTCLVFSNGGIISGLVQGTDYLVTVEDVFNNTICDICLTIGPPPPPNDECTGAIPYPGDVINGTCVTGYDFIGYSDSGISPSPTCDGGDATAWFTFTAPVTTAAGDQITLQWDDGINCGIGIDVYETDCSTPLISSCLNNISGFLPNFIQGNDYLLVLWDDGTGSANCDFCLTVAPPPPPGDECIEPIPYPGDIESETCVTGFDFTAFSPNLGISPFLTCAGFGGSQAWFTITTPITTVAGDPLNLLFDNGICNLALEFYAIDCSGPVGNCLSFTNNGIIFGLTQGTDYLVSIEDLYGGIICDFCLTLAPPPPPNDECTGAIPYPGDALNGTCVTGVDFNQFTDSGISPSANCDGNDATGWFTFTAPIISTAGEPITLEWDNGINCSIGIDVFETDCNTALPSSCLNNSSGLLPNFIQGNDYLLLLWDDGSGSIDCDFCLTIPVIDGCTDPNACNFNVQAGFDDGSCLFVNNPCDDGNPISDNDMVNSNCTCIGTFPPGCNDIILNGSFEAGNFSNWIVSDLTNPFYPLSVDCSGSFSTGFGLNNINPFNGNCMAVNGWEGSGPGLISLHQEVTIPANATSADFNFSWWAAYDMISYGATTDRLFEMQVLPVGGGTPLAIPFTYTAAAGTVELGTGWTNETIDLSAFAGQTIWVCFVETLTEYFTAPAQVAVDNVSLIACINDGCEEEINGAIIPYDPICDVSGIEVTILAPDGTSITVTTNTDGTFSVPGGPFPCGDYTAAFTDVSSLPVCFTTTGSTDPLIFIVDGEGEGDDGPFFFSNPEIPTLSQWGLISLALLLMIFGALKLIAPFATLIK